MTQNNKFAIITLVAISIIAVGIFGITTIVDDVELQENGPGMMVFNSYTTTDRDAMKEISEKIVEGEIVGKYEIVQYRGVNGSFLDENSNEIAQAEPYIVYELLPTEVIKNRETGTSIIKFKTFGGDLNGIQVFTEVPEFEIGDNVIVLLEPAIDGEHYEITSGEFGIYKVSNGRAKNVNSDVSVEQLKQLLR